MRKLVVVSAAFALSLAPVAEAADPPSASGSSPSARALLERSIAYHDPEGLWGEAVVQVVVRGELSEELAARRGYSTTVRRAVIDPPSGRFALSYERDGALVEISVRGDEASVTVDGRSDLAPEELERYGAAPPRPLVLRDYMTYLYGLPMKLRDPGTNLDPEPERTTFRGRDVWSLRVTYDEEVGSDTWYFYLDPETAALVGYRFYHDEAAEDGEFIVLEDEIRAGGLRLPKVRHWYINRDGTYLATDTVQELRVF